MFVPSIIHGYYHGNMWLFSVDLVESRLKAMALPKRFLCLVESGSVSTAFGEVLDIARRMRTAGCAFFLIVAHLSVASEHLGLCWC